ncbi:hypothetical protein A2U01_0071236, partial [Trifolium medium]|nr:hypothetical protein [Trifolium medium]
PHSTLFCVLSPGEVLAVAWRGSWCRLAKCGDMVTSARQLRQNFLPFSRCLSPGEEVATGLCF